MKYSSFFRLQLTKGRLSGIFHLPPLLVSVLGGYERAGPMPPSKDPPFQFVIGGWGIRTPESS